MARRPALGIFLAAVTTLATTGLPAAHAEPGETGQAVITGELEIVQVEDPRDPEEQYFLDVADVGRVPVSPEGLQGAKPQSSVTATVAVPAGVDGSAESGGSRKVAEDAISTGEPLTVLRSDARSSASVVPPVPRTFTPGDHAVTVAIAAARGGAIDPKLTTDVVKQDIARLSSYWSGQSGGRITFSLKATPKRYTSAHTCSDESSMGSEAAGKTGWQRTSNSHLLLIVSGANTNCKLGSATIGAGVNSGGEMRITTFGASMASVLAHEAGHNMSLRHADLLLCPQAPSDVVSPTDCRQDTYGDWWDLMGTSRANIVPSLSAPQAIRSGILPPVDFVTVKASQYLTLKPTGAGSGVRAAVVDVGDGRPYYVEYRSATGTDKHNDDWGGRDNAADPFKGQAYVRQHGVRVLRMDKNNAETVLLADPSRNLGMPAGGMYEAPSGKFSVTVASATASAAQVVIIVGTKPPVATMTLTPSAASQHVDGTPITYTATLDPFVLGTAGTFDFYLDGKLQTSRSAVGGEAEYTLSRLLVPRANSVVSAQFRPKDLTVSSASPKKSRTLKVVKGNVPTASIKGSKTTARRNTKVFFTARFAGRTTRPGGKVNFYDGTKRLGTATLKKSNSTTSYATIGLTLKYAGTRKITAKYQGSGNWNQKNSPTITVRVK